MKVQDTLVNPLYKSTFIWVTFLFFLWGIPNNLNGILIKQFMKSFELSIFQASLVQSVFYIGYFVFALPSAIVMRKYSYKTGLVTGLLLFALGCLLFWPAALLNSYLFFLFSLFIIASGLTFLETGANPFIVELGKEQTAERRLNLSQAFNPLGAILGVLIGTVFVFSGTDPDQEMIDGMKNSGEYTAYLQEETLRVVRPYLCLAVLACIWAFLASRIHFPEKREPQNEKKVLIKQSITLLIRDNAFMKGVLALFLYVGAQVGTWSYFIFYVQEYTGVNEKSAGYMLSGTLIAFALGRLSATWFMKRISPVLLMRIYSFVNVVLIALCVVFTDAFGMWCLLLTSFFMSVMYPTIFSLSVKGLGDQTKIGGSLLVMAILGGAVITPMMGLIMETSNVAYAMFVPLVAYLYIFVYSRKA
ncbi:MAG: L-fucose:H+ symporter permease [Tannerellaceae bacterium]